MLAISTITDLHSFWCFGVERSDIDAGVRLEAVVAKGVDDDATLDCELVAGTGLSNTRSPANAYILESVVGRG